MIVPPAHPAGHENGAALTLAWRHVIGAGFALPRDADRGSAVQAVPALVHGRQSALRGPPGRGAGLKTGGPSLHPASERSLRA